MATMQLTARQIKLASAGGIQDDGSGNLAVKLDGSSLSLSASGIKLAVPTTKGDIVAYSSVPARLPVGSDGQILYADSAQTLGLRWGATPAAPIVVAVNAGGGAQTATTTNTGISGYLVTLPSINTINRVVRSRFQCTTSIAGGGTIYIFPFLKVGSTLFLPWFESATTSDTFCFDNDLWVTTTGASGAVRAASTRTTGSGANRVLTGTAGPIDLTGTVQFGWGIGAPTNNGDTLTPFFNRVETMN